MNNKEAKELYDKATDFIVELGHSYNIKDLHEYLQFKKDRIKNKKEFVLKMEE